MCWCASISTLDAAEISTESFERYLIWYIAVAFDPVPAPSEQIIALPLVQPATISLKSAMTPCTHASSGLLSMLTISLAFWSISSSAISSSSLALANESDGSARNSLPSGSSSASKPLSTARASAPLLHSFAPARLDRLTQERSERAVVAL